MDSYEAAAGRAAEQGKPLTVQDLYDMEFQAQKNKATGRTAGSRLVIARKQNIEAAKVFPTPRPQTHIEKLLSIIPFKVIS